MKTSRFLPVAQAMLVLAWPLPPGRRRRRRRGQERAEGARGAGRDGEGAGRAGVAEHEKPDAGGAIAAFFHGNPDAGTTEFYEFHQWPDQDRVELTKHRDVVEFYVGHKGWEVTYRGKKPMDQEILDDFLRRRDHSIETAMKVWLKDPNTILVYEGQHLVERRLAEQVTLISAQNEAITILMDAQSHLPLRRIFQWRDPLYKDKNTDAEEYDDYHAIDGFPTPLSITRFKNDEMFRQYYIRKVSFNQQLPANFWDVDAADRRIKK